jgi:dihydrofolate synthase/folylpolyglutamate synthase
MNYKEAVDDITSRHSKRKDPAKDTTRETLNLLDKPEEEYNVVLVGGTNGKGSVVEMLSELLQHRGKDVGIYKSPHLTTVRERIKWNGEKISKEDFLELYTSIEALGTDLSFFEFTTCMAYLYFSEKNVDYAIMEVGMGGRLDATNAVETELSVITNLGKDHSKYLGETKEKRAEELTGIAKPGKPLILGEMDEKLIEAAEDREANIKSRRALGGKTHTKLEYRGQEFQIPVRGSFQKENCGTALAAAKALSEMPQNLTKAFQGLECPGRMEVRGRRPLYIQDGAHNPSAIQRIIEDIPEDARCVFNASRDKEAEEMISILEKKTSKFYFTESDVEWATQEAEKLAELTSKPSEVEKDPSKAVKIARREADRDGCVLATGSLYMIGAVRENKNKEWKD